MKIKQKVVLVAATILYFGMFARGTRLYESYGTVEHIVLQNSIVGKSWDVIVRGDDKNIFLLHFHTLPNELKENYRYHLIYMNVDSKCESKFQTRLEISQQVSH